MLASNGDSQPDHYETAVGSWQYAGVDAIAPAGACK
jgi:hypothetical protein